MTTLTLAAATASVSNTPTSAGIGITLLPTTYAGQGIGTNSLIQFANNGAVLLHVITGSGDAPHCVSRKIRRRSASN